MNPWELRSSGERNGPSVRWGGATLNGESGDEEASVLAVVAHERHAAEDGDVEAYLQVFAEDAAVLRPNAKIRRGAALRAAAHDFLEQFRVTWLRFVTTNIAIVGDLAYHEYTYTWELTPRAGGEAWVESGTAYQVLRSRADGSWKITREVWNVAKPSHSI